MISISWLSLSLSLVLKKEQVPRFSLSLRRDPTYYTGWGVMQTAKKNKKKKIIFDATAATAVMFFECLRACVSLAKSQTLQTHENTQKLRVENKWKREREREREQIFSDCCFGWYDLQLQLDWWLWFPDPSHRWVRACKGTSWTRCRSRSRHWDPTPRSLSASTACRSRKK